MATFESYETELKDRTDFIEVTRRHKNPNKDWTVTIDGDGGMSVFYSNVDVSLDVHKLIDKAIKKSKKKEQTETVSPAHDQLLSTGWLR